MSEKIPGADLWLGQSGLVDRRTVLRGTLLASTAMIVATSHLGRAFAQEIRRGGVLNGHLTGDVADLDPVSTTSSRTLTVIGPCYNQLVRYDPLNPSAIVGDLASSWEISDDARTITFHLIDNAHFHDGTPVTSADVKFTFDRVRNPPEGVVSIRKEMLEAVEDITAPDATTVIFHLSRPQRALLTYLATSWNAVVSKAYVEGGGNLKDTIMGSGPFMFKEYVQGVSFELVKNPNYHVPDRPYLDGITFYVIPDRSTAFAQFRTGNINIYDTIGGDEVEQALRTFPDRISLYQATSLTYTNLVFNTKRTPFDDVRVRQAISMAVDRAEMIKVTEGGGGVIAGLLPPGEWALPAEKLHALPGYSPDVDANRERAKALLAEAGYPDGLNVTFLTRRIELFQNRAILVADQLARVGITAEIVYEEANERYAIGDFDVSVRTNNIPTDDPDYAFSAQLCGSSLNVSGACDEDLDAKYREQSLVADPVERLRLVNELETALIERSAECVLFWRHRFAATSPRVMNFVMHPEPDNNRRREETWLAS